MRSIADIVKIARRMDGPNTRYSLAAYLVNMAQRLIPMRRVLKSTGTIYLHCDTTASHYIKIMMDVIFRHGNFGNEIVWHYKRWPAGDRHFQRMHDTILRFQASPKFKFNVQFQPYSGKTIHRRMSVDGTTDLELSRDESRGTKMDDVWDIPYLHSQSKERLGYPTQKPLALLERIIQASTNRGDVVLDPFCGCGTAINAAEKLERQWIGVDISPFATGLVRNRVYRQCNLKWDDFRMLGVPETSADARVLAADNPFEFEKWACGHVGAEGMFHKPGTKGPDKGVDGVLKFFPLEWGVRPKPHYAIVQVKGGGVGPDAVKALYATVEQFEASAGVLICFDDYMRTVENNRNRRTFTDATGTYPIIQGLSVESMLRGKSPALPNLLQKAA